MCSSDLKLVDAAIALVVAALFVKAADKFESKNAALMYWLNVEFPKVRGGLEVVMSGYAGAVDEFESIAPAPVEE